MLLIWYLYISIIFIPLGITDILLLTCIYIYEGFMESTASKADKANRDPREFLIETAIYYADELINQLKEH